MGQPPIPQMQVAADSGHVLSPATDPQQPAYVPEWETYTYGTGIGLSGFSSIDLNRDGKKELVFGSYNCWSVLSYSPEAKSFRLTWQSPSSSVGITQVSAYADTENGDPRILVSLSDGTLELYNGLTLSRMLTVKPNAAVAAKILLADGDNDGRQDVVVLYGSKTLMLDPVTLVVRRTLDEGAAALAIGNVDADPEVELVYSSGRVITQKADNSQLKWELGASEFGPHLKLADIDGDARQDIVTAQSWYTLSAYDAQAKVKKWEIRTTHDIHALHLADVTGDGRAEVIFGDGQWGAIHALDGANHSLLWSIGNPEHGVTDIHVFDADADGQLDVLWGSGHTSSGPDYLYVAGIADQKINWRSTSVDGPFLAVDIGDVDGEAGDEYVFASFESESGYGDGQVSVVDVKTKAVKWQSDSRYFGGHAWEGVRALRVGDVDGDRQADIVVGTDRLYDGAIYVINGKSHEKKLYTYDSGSPMNSLELVDVDKDGVLDIVAGNSKVHTGSPGQFVYVIDGRDGQVKWKSSSLQSSGWGGVTALAAADVNQDGVMDYVAANGSVSVIDGNSKAQRESAETAYTTLVLNDSQRSGRLDIIAGTGDGKLVRLDPSTLQKTELGSVCTDAVHSLSGLASGQLMFACGQQLVQYDTVAKRSVWSSEPLGFGISRLAAVQSADKMRVLVGGSRVMALASTGSMKRPTVQGAEASTHWRTTLRGQLEAQNPNPELTLSYLVTSSPRKGQLTLESGGAFSYTPSGKYVGDDEFQFRVSNGTLDSDIATVKLHLTNTNPVANSKTFTTHWRKPMTAQLEAVDGDSDPLLYSLVQDAGKGEVVITDAARGTFRYTPKAGVRDGDSFSFRVGDEIAESATAVVTLVYTNQKPVAEGGAYSIYPDATINGKMNASDGDGDSLSYVLVAQPSKGSVTVDAANGLFVYKPNANASGSDSFSFKAHDGYEDSATATVKVEFKAESSSGGGGGGGLGWLVLALLPCLRWRKV